MSDKRQAAMAQIVAITRLEKAGAKPTQPLPAGAIALPDLPSGSGPQIGAAGIGIPGAGIPTAPMTPTVPPRSSLTGVQVAPLPVAEQKTQPLAFRKQLPPVFQKIRQQKQQAKEKQAPPPPGAMTPAQLIAWQARQETMLAQRNRRIAVQLENTANAAMGLTRNVFHAGAVRLGSLPTPGSIALPLIILLLLWILLIPIKGQDGTTHTRAMWFWMAFLGVAKISPVFPALPVGSGAAPASGQTTTLGVGSGPESSGYGGYVPEEIL